MFFDTHFHLDLMAAPEAVIKMLEERQIYTIAVTNLPKVFFHTARLCETQKYVKPALGYHPELIFKHDEQLDLFEELCEQTRYIGEVGLDNMKKSAEDFSKQVLFFERIIAICAQKRNKILTIHSRKAEKEVISIIGKRFPGKVILHWYSGSLANMADAIDNGFYFSVNWPMTQSNAGRRIIEALPVNRILLETDGPFTSYDNRPCLPGDTSMIMDEVIKIKRAQGNMSLMPDVFFNNFRSVLTII